jgi:hypothetical protein
VKTPYEGAPQGIGVGAPIDDPILSAVRASPTLATAIFAGALVAVRLLAVSNYRIDIALGLLSSAGASDVILGSALSLLPFAAPLIFIYLWSVSGTYFNAGRRAYFTAYGLGISFGVSVLLSPVGLLALVIALFVALWALSRLRGSRGRPHVRRPEVPVVFAFSVIGVPLFAFSLLVGIAWMPVEVVETRDTTIVGYVAESDSKWTYILQYEPRLIQIVATADVTQRTICEMPRDLLDKPISELGTRPGPPACPTK